MKTQFLRQKSIVTIILVRDIYMALPKPFLASIHQSLFNDIGVYSTIPILFLLGRRKKRKPVRHRLSSDNVIASTDLANGIFGGGGSGWGDKVGGGVSDESNVSNTDTTSSAQQSSRGQQPLIAALGFVISRTIGVPPSSRCVHQRTFVAVY